MGYNRKIPPIKFIESKCWYDELIEALEYNISATEDTLIINQAEKLLEKIRTYARFKTNEDNEEIADIRFFEGEAEILIFQLLLSKFLSNMHIEVTMLKETKVLLKETVDLHKESIENKEKIFGLLSENILLKNPVIDVRD